MILPLRVLGRASATSIDRGATAGPSRERANPMMSRTSCVGLLVAGGEGDVRLDDLAHRRVGESDHAGLGHRGVLDQDRLDLERADRGDRRT